MKRTGDSTKKTTSRLRKLSAVPKKKSRPPDSLLRIKSTNKLSAHNSTSNRCSSQNINIVKLKDVSLTAGLRNPPRVLQVSSAQKAMENSYGSVSTNGAMRTIKEFVGLTPEQEYGDGPETEVHQSKA